MTDFSTKSILITRPHKESISFARLIRSVDKSIKTYCGPLFEIENLPIAPDFFLIDGAIVTSSNAVKSLKHSNVHFDGPLFCVGEATAVLAKKAGFQSLSANGTVKQLENLITQSISSKNKKLVYFRGEQIKKDLARSLREKNYKIDELTCYRKLPRNLSSQIISDIDSGLINGAAFFSQDTANLFFNQIKKIPDNFTVFCISTDVSRVLKTLYPNSRLSVKVADKPSMKEMCKLIVAASHLT